MHNECTRRIQKLVEQNLWIYTIHFIYRYIGTLKMIFVRPSCFMECIELFYFLSEYLLLPIILYEVLFCKRDTLRKHKPFQLKFYFIFRSNHYDYTSVEYNYRITNLNKSVKINKKCSSESKCFVLEFYSCQTFKRNSTLRLTTIAITNTTTPIVRHSEL